MPYVPRYREQISSQQEGWFRIERGMIELVADISDWKCLFFVCQRQGQQRKPVHIRIRVAPRDIVPEAEQSASGAFLIL